VNAEKVILDHVDLNPQPKLWEETEDEKALAANETRTLIGKIPSMSIFIDEAHHAADNEIKLRSVVSKWAESGSVCNVLGFSGTPFLNSPDKVTIAPGLEIKSPEITNTVYYYPLVEGIGNFLKKPVVNIIRDANDSLSIVQRGIEEFIEKFRDKRYTSGACAKLAIYCGSIERLEKQIYPLAVGLCEKSGIERTAILRYHRGNKEHPQPTDSEIEFAQLDSPSSPYRIILLVQIGKEGWDCRSLAGVILSQANDCPKNMVLQTSCRCLREVDAGQQEEAIIVLNQENGSTLSAQLSKQHHTTLDEFQAGRQHTAKIERHDRTRELDLPDIPFMQMRISYNTTILENQEPPTRRLKALIAELPSLRRQETIQTSTFDELLDKDGAQFVRESDPTYFYTMGRLPHCPFLHWLDLMRKESFCFWNQSEVSEDDMVLLRQIHAAISFQDNDGRVFLSGEYDQAAIRSRVITAFWPHRRLSVDEEVIPECARLLRIDHLKSPIEVPAATVNSFIPDQEECRRIIKADNEGTQSSEALAKAIRKLARAEADGDAEEIEFFRAQLERAQTGRSVKDRTYHYLPYRTDSAFERSFLKAVLQRQEFLDRNLEIYYNGDESLTEFRIQCYKRLSEAEGGVWSSVGAYTPDFLIIKRDKSSNAIASCLIVETKGRLYANDPAFQDRRDFMQSVFLQQNDRHDGLPRFQYICLEETANWNNALMDAIKGFFK
ncbi:MAG: hypothetical protein IJS15_12080, partial [Victivallales bacterium]|nr:hypothetical protein [Victivallales bacterium]